MRTRAQRLRFFEKALDGVAFAEQFIDLAPAMLPLLIEVVETIGLADRADLNGDEESREALLRSTVRCWYEIEGMLDPVIESMQHAPSA